MSTEPNPDLWRALTEVHDPEIRKPVTELGMIDYASVSDSGVAKVGLVLTIQGCPAATSIEQATINAALSAPGVTEAQVSVRVMTPAERAVFVERVRGSAPKREAQFGPESLTRVIAVTSGKGGVGKSSVTANLAVALADSGLSVGVIDADIFGFSIPGLLGLTHDGVTSSPTRIDDMILAPTAHGVQVISIGMFLGGADSRDTAVSWRGPMLHRTLEQFLKDVWFGSLDMLLLDLPPGTGDVALSLGQLLPQAEVLVVTTPQLAAADVAVRSGVLALQSGQRILGVVETMSAMRQPDGSLFELFGSGGGSAVASRLSAHERLPKDHGEVPLLTSVPLSMKLREAGDAGVPLVSSHPDDPASLAIAELARRVRTRSSSLAGQPLGVSPQR